MNKEITIIIEGKLTKEMKIEYAKTLAISLLNEYGKSGCKELLDLNKNIDEQ
ncbi:hypothetical protein [Clostridium folliculivorans]|uniref:Uncharacterized protein n=1 Tax=Clostridium folliculivorans TaxID=2886038 RepID=A0A9W5XZW1_9CLOT|nr:hypothetical protein [Clostridium folliculivorans]GKU24023.1 hypothetical protein CFOLD11_08490 [Clostridium folliculivorans]GKU30138.1 hypothetical protein CFB3_22450 [Clostridium folliculivorans]